MDLETIRSLIRRARKAFLGGFAGMVCTFLAVGANPAIPMDTFAWVSVLFSGLVVFSAVYSVVNDKQDD